jgi:hypothetical protein
MRERFVANKDRPISIKIDDQRTITREKFQFLINLTINYYAQFSDNRASLI